MYFALLAPYDSREFDAVGKVAFMADNQLAMYLPNMISFVAFGIFLVVLSLALHERLWHVRLTCPGGGEYAWNPEAQTMESSVFGHPGTPERVAPLPAALERLLSFDAGVSFELDGVRARAAIERRAR